MIKFKKISGKYAYLADTDKSFKRNRLKLTSSLGIILGLCALSIWFFSPVSTQTHHTQKAQLISSLVKAAPEEHALPASVFANRRITSGAGASADTTPTLNSATLTKASANDETTKQEVNLAAIEFASIEPAFLNKNPPLNKTLPALTPDIEQVGHSESYTINAGDTLTKIFTNADLPVSQAIKLAQTKAARQLNKLSIGKTLRIYFDTNDQWEALEYDISKLETLIVTPNNGEFEINTFKKAVEFRQFSANGIIHSSLGIAAEKAGISNTLSRKLTDIYKWEIDFARDTRQGDTFSVVYQKAFVDGKYLEDGSILAASFTNRGRTIEAVRYTDSNAITAYFQPNGESLRRGFLRTPVKLARITSGFGKRRHPINKTWKNHMGVDYGAKRGTPIFSTADGVVQYAGKKGGYGKTVILRHGGIYTTLYAHMSKLGKGVRSGKAVTQGQIIGYVGHTGWATGDHLHYEFRVNGQHKNPLKVKLPKTLPLAKKEINAFNQQAEPLLITLTSLKGEHVAGISKTTSPQATF